MDVSEPVVESDAASRGCLDDGYPGANAEDVSIRQVAVEFDDLGQIDLADDGDVGRIEDRRILYRLILAFGHGEDYGSDVLAEIIARRTHQIPDVLDEEHVDLGQDPALEGFIDHLRFEMARRTGADLPNGYTRSRQPCCVVFCCQISDEGSDSQIRMQRCECSFQQHRLSGAGTRDEVHHERAGLLESLSQSIRQLIILFQNAVTNVDDACFRLHH